MSTHFKMSLSFLSLFKQKVDILVFPEDGIYGVGFTRSSIYPYLEAIPDPEVVTWSACTHPHSYPETDVQHSLSCMAKRNKMYIVANMGDKIACHTKTDPKCPPDGRYQYNTGVVFDPDGVLVAKYHKRNLFFEFQFDTPDAKSVFVDTPFGRLGVIICFDALFHDPAINLVMDHNVTTILFPTAWMDLLPIVSAVGYHSSFARGLGINMLGANIHYPEYRFHGSGIYTPNGINSFYYNDTTDSPGKLLVSDLNIIKKPLIKNEDGLNMVGSNSLKTEFSKGSKVIPKTISKNQNTDQEFQSYMYGDLYTFKSLTEKNGTVEVCDGKVCCYLSYEMDTTNDHDHSDLFAFGVFNGLHTYDGKFYFQVCSLLRCSDSANKSSCGNGTSTSSTVFKSLHMIGHFQTKFIYPQVMLSKDGHLEPAISSQWNFRKSTPTVKSIESLTGFDNPLLSASLFGHYYQKDGTEGDSSLGSSPGTHKLIVLVPLALSIILIVGIIVIV